MDEHVERGGLQWGPSLGKGGYGYRSATWPFVTAQLSSVRLRLAVTSWNGKREDQVFEFTNSELRSVRRTGWLFHNGFVFEHDRCNYPNLVRFFSFKPSVLWKEFHRFGYKLVEAGR